MNGSLGEASSTKIIKKRWSKEIKFYRESNKGSKERQGTKLIQGVRFYKGVRLIEWSVVY